MAKSFLKSNSTIFAPMVVDYIIVGQGISGTWLSWFLLQTDKSFVVIDHQQLNSASRIAAGIINPVSGKRFVIDETHEEQIQFAVNNYQAFESYFNTAVITATSILQSLDDNATRTAFEKRLNENKTYLSIQEDNGISQIFNSKKTVGIIHPCYKINIPTFTAAIPELLIQKNQLLHEAFDYSLLNVTNGLVVYKNIEAKNIIFADGISGQHNPYLQHLSFANTKGEAIIVNIPDLPDDKIFKEKYMLVPMGGQQFWIGASTTWAFTDDLPSTAFYNQTKTWLEQLLKIPFTITSHIAGIRPTLTNRQPVSMIHPLYSNMAFINGMGAKACSVAPKLAMELIQKIENK